MKNENEQNDQNLKGTDLTQEQFSDVYMAGTSDGVHQLAEGKIKIENEPFDLDINENKP
jgi:hypothetical protein